MSSRHRRSTLRRISLLLVLPLAAARAADAGESVSGASDVPALFHSANPQLDANKQLAYRYFTQLISAGDWAKADGLLSTRYLEHDPRTRSGRNSVVRFLRADVARVRPDAGPRALAVVAVVAERDLVAVIEPSCELIDSGPPARRYNTIWVDIWRVADGRLAEHWDTAMIGSPVRPSYAALDCLSSGSPEAAGQATVTGAADADALFHSTDPPLDRNKQLAWRMLKDMVEAGHWELARDYATERYIQHNPAVPSGRTPAIRFFTETLKMPQHPVADRLKMAISMVIAEGDYVVIAEPRHGTDAKGKPYSSTWVDLWRMSSGRADEHWDAATLQEQFKP